jgi:hypothetical protein
LAVVRHWPADQVEALATRLGEFLVDPAAPPLRERSETGRWGAWLVLGLVVGVLLVMAAVVWPRTLQADRPAGWVAVSGPFRPWHRPLGAVEAVRIERAIDIQVDRLRRRRRPMSYAAPTDLPARIVLEMEGTGARAVTTWFPSVLESPSAGVSAEERRAEARSHLEATAGALAAALGVPLRPLREVPPPGIVPPPLDEGPEGSRTPDVTPT